MTTLAAQLMEVYARLHGHYGHEPHWWPIFGPDRRWEIVLGAVLVQQSRWERVEAAVLTLLGAGCYTPGDIAAQTPASLAPLLRGVAFPQQKAPQIIGLARHVLARADGDVARWLAQPPTTARAELLGLPGIGPESADVILVYAGGHALMVVDAYLRRVLARLGLLSDAPAQPYEQLRHTLEAALGPELDLGAFPHLSGSRARLLWDFHALINEHCIHHCLARLPRCDDASAPRRPFTKPEKCAAHCPPCAGCPLRDHCAAYQAGLLGHR